MPLPTLLPTTITTGAIALSTATTTTTKVKGNV
jgi:hypothetical protein